MIVFLHIPKTAGSTFQFILENSFGLSACHSNHNKKNVFRQDDFDFARKIFPRMKSLAGHNLLDPLSLTVPEPFHVTFLREPVARVFSHYQDSVVAGGNTLNFEEDLRRSAHLENWHVRLMAGGEADLDKAKYYLERCSFVGLTEKFDLSLHVLGKLSPLPLNLNYKRKRTATSNIGKSLAADPRIVDMVREHNRLDLELYDFALKEIFPKLCAQAGFSPDAKVSSYENYTSESQWRYQLCHAYNLLVYRSACKLRRRS